MAYLSRIWINPLRQQGRRLLEDPRAMHAAVLGGIPTDVVTERVLWRIDSDEHGHRSGLIVVSRSRPSWEHIVEQAGWPASHTPDTPQATVKAYEPLLDRLADGQTYAFRLTANPAQSTRTSANGAEADQGLAPTADGRRRSVRHGHRTARHQLTWLVDRAPTWGFDIPPARSSEATDAETAHDVRIVARNRRSFRHRRRGHGPDGSGPVTLQVVSYEGKLTVADAEQLRRKLLEGCGPAKAYGCGLLTLAPLPSAAGES